MKFLPLLLVCFASQQLFAQKTLPFYYEQNMPLYGRPSGAEEYYYEYHTQVRAHYYHHTMEYDSAGRIKRHVKTNAGLLDPDSIPLAFQGIIDLRPITITYAFSYDAENRLGYFIKEQVQEQVGTFRQDEEWKYDAQGILTEHNFWEVDSSGSILKDPSMHRIISRDALQQVQKIEKYTYVFVQKGLILTEITEYIYGPKRLDTISTYKVNNGTAQLAEKKYNLIYEKYDSLNTDSILFASYSSLGQDSQVTFHSFFYDHANRMTASYTTDLNSDTVTSTLRIYEPLKFTEITDGDSAVTYYDETGYERYHEEFDYGNSLGVPADMNTRTIENGRIENALSEVWDPVTLFYRKDTEYLFLYDALEGVVNINRSSKQLLVYPNPSSGTLYLRQIEGMQSLRLFASDGTSYILPLASTIPTNFPKGIYLLQATFLDGSFQTAKLVFE